MSQCSAHCSSSSLQSLDGQSLMRSSMLEGTVRPIPVWICICFQLGLQVGCWKFWYNQPRVDLFAFKVFVTYNACQVLRLLLLLLCFFSVTGSILVVVGLYLVLWGKGRELKKLSNLGGKDMEEELEEGGGSTVANNSMPMYCSPGHEAGGSQPQDGGVKVCHGSTN